MKDFFLKRVVALLLMLSPLLSFGIEEVSEEIRNTFEKLHNECLKKFDARSDTREIMYRPDYQKIRFLGARVIPLLVRKSNEDAVLYTMALDMLKIDLTQYGYIPDVHMIVPEALT